VCTENFIRIDQGRESRGVSAPCFRSFFILAILASPFKSRIRLEAENAALRHQLIVLRRKMHGRAPLTNNVRLDRRDLVWINVTANPTAEWIARQITEALPWDDAPQYLIRDRDRIYGSVVTRRLRAMGIRDKPTAPASPWQNGFAERLIGSIRRECVDHFVVLGEAHLRRTLGAYARYYNDIRTHRSLNKDAPVSRPVQRTGVICSHAILGGLHHQYVRV
jgi:transposase InsO family protein